MMEYPKNYALVPEEEMEYITGGKLSTSVNPKALARTVLGVAASFLATLNVGNIAGVAAQIQKAYPEEYPEEEGTINGNLIIDSSVVYFRSLGGALLGLTNVAAAAGYVYFMLIS